MLKMNQRITNSAEEVMMMSDKFILELIAAIRTKANHMFKVCEGLALLHMLASFTHSVTTLGYNRPTLSTTMAPKAARHPILEKVYEQVF